MFYVTAFDSALASELCEHATKELGVACAVAAPGQKADMTLIEEAAPYRLSELLARLAQAETLRFGEYTLSVRDRKLNYHAQDIALTDKETQLLQALIVTKGGVAKETLLKDIWGFEAELNTHTLETHIYRLRAKLKDLSGSETILATDKGYTLYG